MFEDVRSVSARLTAPLSAEDQQVQSMPDASPTKWHLAHTNWFFETFILQPHLDGYEEFNPAFKVLFYRTGDRVPLEPEPDSYDRSNANGEVIAWRTTNTWQG